MSKNIWWVCKSCGTRNYYLSEICKKCHGTTASQQIAPPQSQRDVRLALVKRKYEEAKVGETSFVASIKTVGNKPSEKSDNISQGQRWAIKAMNMQSNMTGGPRKRAKQAKAFACAANDGQMEAAISELRRSYFSSNTVLSYGVHVRLYDGLCLQRGIVPWPPSPQSLEVFGALLNKAGYRGGHDYLSGVKAASLNMGFHYDAHTEYAATLVKRGLKRGKGEQNAKFPVDANVLEKIQSLCFVSQEEQLIGNLITIGVTLMMRSDELLHIQGVCRIPNCQCGCHVHIHNKRAIVNIAGDKMNIEKKNCPRPLECKCQGDRAKISACAVCAIENLVQLCTGERDGLGTLINLANGIKKKPLKAEGLRRGIISLLKRSGVINNPSEEKDWGSHSLRRGGAIILTLMGWSLDLIMKWGRWESLCVMRYVLEAPVEFAGGHVVCDILKSVAATKCDGSINLTKDVDEAVALLRAQVI